MLGPLNTRNLKPEKNYLNYRWFFTSDDKLVVGGKSDSQNELVIRNFLHPDYTIMHTSEPGSSFMIIQHENPTKKDLDETAIFCGCFSKQWKLGKRLIEVDVFKGSQIYKTKSMKLGTLGVQGDKKTVKINPELALVIQQGKLRAVPKTTKEKNLAIIKPGKMTKEKSVDKIAKIIKDEFNFPISREEIMQAIPSNNISVN